MSEVVIMLGIEEMEGPAAWDPTYQDCPSYRHCQISNILSMEFNTECCVYYHFLKRDTGHLVVS